MTQPVETPQTTPETKRKFFISYEYKDREKAEKVASILDDAEQEVVIFPFTFKLGKSARHQMQQALEESDHVVALYSGTYFTSQPCMYEFFGAWQRDIIFKTDKLLPLRVTKNDLPDFVNDIIYCNLSEAKNDDEFEDGLLKAVGIRETKFAREPSPTSIVQPVMKGMDWTGKQFWRIGRWFINFNLFAKGFPYVWGDGVTRKDGWCYLHNLGRIQVGDILVAGGVQKVNLIGEVVGKPVYLFPTQETARYAEHGIAEASAIDNPELVAAFNPNGDGLSDVVCVPVKWFEKDYSSLRMPLQIRGGVTPLNQAGVDWVKKLLCEEK